MSLRDQYEQQIEADKARQAKANEIHIPLGVFLNSGWEELAELVKPEKWNSCFAPLKDENFSPKRYFKGTSSFWKIGYKMPLWVHFQGEDGKHYADEIRMHDFSVYMTGTIAGEWQELIDAPKKGLWGKFSRSVSSFEVNNYKSRRIPEWLKEYEERKRVLIENKRLNGETPAAVQEYVMLEKPNKSYCILFRDGHYFTNSSEITFKMEDFLPEMRKLNGD